VEGVDHLEHGGQRPDVAQPVLGLEDQAELERARDAVGDQLLVAVLEDVQRHALAREEDQLEREQADLRHDPGSLCGYSPRVPSSVARIAESFFRPSVRDLVPYEPGKPVEEVQRELGLERCVKLASNEGPFGPFPAALEALARCVADLNRYPDGGAWRLRKTLA